MTYPAPRNVHQRLQDAATDPTVHPLTTDLQKTAHADGKAVHADGRPRPNGMLAEATYGTEAPWYLLGWDEADGAAPADGAARAATRIALIGCGSAKTPHAAPARDLYTGHLFRKAVRYAEATCTRWYVLSARHGLVHPDTVLEPYDVKLGRSHPDPARDAPTTHDWARLVRHGLATELADVPRPTLVVLAGEAYRAFVHPCAWPYEVPMQGLGIGQQLSWLNTNTP